MKKKNLAERSLGLGKYFLDGLKTIENPLIKEIRGKGLFIGVELTEAARPYCEKLKEEGLLCKETHDFVIRFAPPLIIKKMKLTGLLIELKKFYPNKSYCFEKTGNCPIKKLTYQQVSIIVVKVRYSKQQQEEQESLNMLHNTQTVIHEALRKLGYQDSMFELLKEPLRLLNVRFPVRMDDGSVRGFYRLPFPA